MADAKALGKEKYKMSLEHLIVPRVKQSSENHGNMFKKKENPSSMGSFLLAKSKII